MITFTYKSSDDKKSSDSKDKKAKSPNVEKIVKDKPSLSFNTLIFDKNKLSKIDDIGKVIESDLKKGSKKVALKRATDLHVPVSGTNKESTYWTIAVGEYANMAIRFVWNSLSLRIEFKDEYKDAEYLALQSLGMKDSGSHWSIHFKNVDKELCKKAIGAMLMGSAIKFDRISFNVEQVFDQ